MKLKNTRNDLTKGSVLGALLSFSLPYLLSCFLQTFYGLADLYVTGQYYGAEAISAVSIGSQVMHMLTVIIVGLAMGATVTISRAVGEKNTARAGRAVGNTVFLFLLVSVALTLVLLTGTDRILDWIQVPKEAIAQTKIYLLICFAGIPFITAYNIISCIFRGMGDSRSPLYFVAAACVMNIGLDFFFIGSLGLGAAGAALGTVVSQTGSVILALIAMKKKSFGLCLKKEDFYPEKGAMGTILKVGVPIAFQDGFIQISFMIITVIANQRGVVAAASVGIVEKLISFFFLVPSAMLSSVSAIAAQNVGAGRHKRAFKVLKYGLLVCVCFGLTVVLVCQVFSSEILSLFADASAVIEMGSQYLRSYVFDCAVAGVHFCFSGYFCAYGKSMLSFVQNLIAIVLVRIPGAYLASVMFPDTLYPMGLAAPAGSLLSAIICIVFFIIYKKKYFLSSEGID